MRIMKKKNLNVSGVDPKAAALTTLGIAIGNKNLRSLLRDEVDSAFIETFHESVTKPPQRKNKNGKFNSWLISFFIEVIITEIKVIMIIITAL